MEPWQVTLLIVFCVIFLIVGIVFLTAYICFRMAFFSRSKKPISSEDIDLPPDDIYVPFHEKMRQWALETRALPCREFQIKSFDGLTLYGKYYECDPAAPIELMMHGYRGSAERDLSGGVQRCFALGRNVLIVDQRACGKSEGNVITFGINESRDCISWIQLLIEQFGENVKIVLTGISMGASTVIMASGRGLPDNVKGILADCGYSSPEKIIKKVIKDMKLPPNVMYPFVQLGARLYGRFNLSELSPLEALKTCTVPVIFLHGDADAFVPYEMSCEMYQACTAPKRLVTAQGAGHGLAYPIMEKKYFEEVATFFTENGLPTQVKEDRKNAF